MAIRDVSGLPDDQVPEWVRLSRERAKERAEERRRFLEEEAAKTKETS